MSGRGSAWLECLPWEQEVAGSNPVAPTLFKFAEYVDYVFIKTKLKYKTGKDFSRKKE